MADQIKAKPGTRRVWSSALGIVAALALAIGVNLLVERFAPRARLDPSPTRAIVTRVLTNHKHLHIDRGENDAGLAVVDRLLLLGGEVPAELRDRGLLLLRLARNAEGARDLERYISLAPDAADRSAVEAVLARARRG